MENVQIELTENQRELRLTVDGHKAGEMGILISGNVLTVYHTQVSAQYEGQGFAKMLLEKLVGHAREHQMKIVAICPYVHAQFRRHPDEYADIWLRSER